MANDVMVYVNGTGVKNNRITIKTQGGDQHKDSGDNKSTTDTKNFNVLDTRLDDPQYYG